LTTGPEGEYRLDFAFPPLKLAIEVDGYVHHFSADHARRDNARRNQLQRQGWLVLVYTWRDVVREPARVSAEIAETYQTLTTLTMGRASRPA
jgi:very-short-patch-repair endonuclease